MRFFCAAARRSRTFGHQTLPHTSPPMFWMNLWGFQMMRPLGDTISCGDGSSCRGSGVGGLTRSGVCTGGGSAGNLPLLGSCAGPAQSGSCAGFSWPMATESSLSPNRSLKYFGERSITLYGPSYRGASGEQCPSLLTKTVERH